MHLSLKDEDEEKACLGRGPQQSACVGAERRWTGLLWGACFLLLAACCSKEKANLYQVPPEQITTIDLLQFKGG
jgi:hypothetical protein